MAKYLTIVNSKLRVDWGDATLILSESEEKPCCCASCDVTESLNGGPGTTVKTYTFPSTEEEIEFTWDAYSIPDAFTVDVEGAVKVDTGSVSNTGKKCFTKEEGKTEITVTVVGPEGTAWTYSLKCGCTCSEDPGPNAEICYNISDSVYANVVRGTYYGGAGGKGGLNPVTGDGWPKCVRDKYKLVGYVRAGAGLDDYGEICGVPLDNHVPCDPGLTGKTTITTADSPQFDLSWLPDPDDPEMFFIPIDYVATSSNCGPPSGVNATVCVKFEPYPTLPPPTN